MSKRQSIGLSYPQNDNEYFNLLKKYRLSSLLNCINQESQVLITSEPCGIRCVNYSFYDETLRQTYSQNVIITAWGLVDLAYDAIVKTNDYRGRNISKYEELCILVSALADSKQRTEAKLIDNLPERGGHDFFTYLWGFTGEQAKMQSPGKILQNAARELYMVLNISKKIEDIEDVEEIIIKEAGTTWRNVLILYGVHLFITEISVCFIKDFTGTIISVLTI